MPSLGDAGSVNQIINNKTNRGNTPYDMYYPLFYFIDLQLK